MCALGIEIRVARLRAGLTQAELGSVIYRHQTSVSDYEQGKCQPDQQTLIQIAIATGCEELISAQR